CIVVCDDLGYCDTTYIYITVVESNFKPNAVDDYRSTLEGKPIIISVLDNDTYGSGTVKVNLISKPDNATVSMYGTKLLTVTPQKGNCEPLEFQYAITNEFGSDTATVFVNINCNDLVFNNGITPNHDGLNDVFFIEGIDKYPDNKLTVFNRWGNQVYSADKYKNDWDGSWNSKMLPDGTYFYIFEDGIGNTYSGYIQILR
ncbi:MAG TPA: gliding motility-associated C-terminal domain-containing protein, partial [Saprospiraceae bacterium]|nr:gliding motility-associated C-terminal domain-containing protein [Saprospiraceae bacterium]